MSVVIPVLHDDEALAQLLSQLGSDPRVEVVVAGPPPVGRGAQMNAGARRATAPCLLFLHAESRLPAAWLEAVLETLSDPAVVGGWFRFALDARGWQPRLIERLVALRVRFFRLPYGDQGYFVRRDAFAAIGGYRELPLMEDVDFVRRLVRAGRVVEVKLPLATSARRWRRDGWLRRSARNLTLVTLYMLGVPPVRLARWYS